MAHENQQSFEVVFTELESKIPMSTYVTASSKEEAEQIFLKTNIDKHIVKNPENFVYPAKGFIEVED